MNSGRRADGQRLRLMAALRRQGLSYAEIGRRLRVSRQAVCRSLRSMERRGCASCSACGAEIDSAVATNQDRDLLCRLCLGRRSNVPPAQVLRSLRIAMGWTQNELAERVGLSPSLVSLVETGKGPPGPRSWARLLGVLGAPPSCLADGRKRGQAS